MNSDNHYAIIMDREKGPIEYHRFTLDLPHRKHIGRAIKSYNAFCESRNPKRDAPYDIYLRDADTFKSDIRFAWQTYNRCKQPVPKVPVYFHESIWELYDFLGYDYKRKRFDQELYANVRKHRPQTPQDSRVCFADYLED